jgi:alpha/beta superfamily hydrolase
MKNSKEIMIPGPAGQIETVIEQPDTSAHKLIGIVCHPHPLHQGTMNNKVVTTVARVFELMDIVPVRFNFRGVGRSEGQHDYAVGELADLRAVINWLKGQYPDYKFVLAGFSFGSYIATKVATEINPAALITIAPPVHHNDFVGLPPINFPWVVVQGEADEVVPPNEVFTWLDSLTPQPTVIKMPGVGHFFHGQLLNLRDQLTAWLKSNLIGYEKDPGS